MRIAFELDLGDPDLTIEDLRDLIRAAEEAGALTTEKVRVLLPPTWIAAEGCGPSLLISNVH